MKQRAYKGSRDVVRELDHTTGRFLGTITGYNPAENNIDVDEEHMRGEPCDGIVTNVSMAPNIHIDEWHARNGKSEWGAIRNVADAQGWHEQSKEKRRRVVKENGPEKKSVA